jgi:formate--tetrahydrofolate ligase
LVATVRALKYHGGCSLQELGREDLSALDRGIANLARHIDNIREHYGLPCIVSVNQFTSDTPQEFELLRRRVAEKQVLTVSARHWAEGGAGAEDLARAVVELAEKPNPNFHFVYEDSLPLWEKLKAVATRIYGAADVSADEAVLRQIAAYEEAGYGRYPICVAKTQYSFSTDPKLRGAPSGHIVNVREVRLAAGAEFIVLICGNLLTMPGLPKHPAAQRISVAADGKVTGLF